MGQFSSVQRAGQSRLAAVSHDQCPEFLLVGRSASLENFPKDRGVA
jgi:hypothetical protein